MDAAEERAAEDQQTKDENAVLAELIMGSSAVGVLTERLGWKMRDGRPYVKRVYRALNGCIVPLKAFKKMGWPENSEDTGLQPKRVKKSLS
jgi:hypothetical protein